MPRRASPDPELPTLALREDALAAGMTCDQVRQRVRSGAWVRVRRGAYLPDPESAFAGLDEYARARVEHVHRAVAAAERNRGTVICDGSAAIVHRLPLRRQLQESR